MNFNKEQSKKVYEFILKYNTDSEFKKSMQQLYDNDTYKLSILYIYALEEVLKYGKKGFFNKFLKTIGTYSEDQEADLYDGFIKLLSEDINFKRCKIQQFEESPDTLSSMEMFAFTLISNSNNQEEQNQEKVTDKLEYDSYNPILYSNDRQIRETLENLILGEFIHNILKLPCMESIRARQKDDGRIANIDKPFIIEKIQGTISDEKTISQFKQIIDSRFVKVKMDLLLGKGELAFEQYLKFNTNISSSEIFGIEDDYSATDMYNFFNDIIKKRKEQEFEKRKK